MKLRTDDHGVLADGFRPHAAVLHWLNSGGVLTVNDVPLSMWTARPGDHVDRRVFEARVNFGKGQGWLLLVAEVHHDDPVVVVTAGMIRGDISNPSPLIDRVPVRLGVRQGEGVVTIDDDPNSESAKTGQGVCVRRLEIVCESPMLMTPEAGAHLRAASKVDGVRSTQMVPRYATQTGGSWWYMGDRHDLDRMSLEDWREQLYPMLGYPGFNLTADGHWLEERMRPDAVVTAGGDFHQGAKDKGPIDYGGKEPWDYRPAPDQTGGKMRAPDDQHLTVYSAVAECGERWPDDEGFRMINHAIAARYPLQLNDHGPNDGYGLNRGGARPLMVACDLWRALLKYDDAVSMHYVAAMAQRAQLVLDEMLAAIDADPAWPWARFAGADGRAACAEIGLVWWGFGNVLALLPAGGKLRERVQTAQAMASKWCFDSFKKYANGFGVPYWRQRDGTEHPGGKSGGTRFVWAPAMAHPHDPTEAWKKAELISMASSIPKRWRP